MLKQIKKVLYGAKNNTITINIDTLEKIAKHIDKIENDNQVLKDQVARLKVQNANELVEKAKLAIQLSEDYERFEEFA